MQFSSKILSQSVTQLCLIKGINYIVISPGSRNAPLTIGFTEHPDFKNFSIVDERCAAFFALGMAQQLKQPVALVCTSGSALLNYYPAIAEAFYSDIPLVVISADRPADLVEIGDGQTIKQENVYANHILYSANCIEGSEHQTHNETEINIALNTAIELKGPVHINVPFSEPLYERVADLKVRPQHVPARENHTIASETLEDYKQFLSQWNAASKKMILVGTLPPNSIEANLINALSKDKSVLVLTETTSNLQHPTFISAIDQLISTLTEAEFKELQPDILVTFGGLVVSKRIKAFLRKYPAKIHAHIDEKKAYNTYFSLTHHFKTKPNHFLNTLVANTNSSKYQSKWLKVKAYRETKHQLYFKQILYSDFKVFDAVFRELPKNIQLQLANSATVRYAQLFPAHHSHTIFCNRGTSGIDGSTSTAIGAAYVADKPTVFVTGDLSFLYDSNALWNTYIPKNFKIIIVNNSGGGIFRILKDAKKAENFETYFETRHQLNAKHLAEMFQFKYTSVSEEKELIPTLSHFFSQNTNPSILEIFTPPSVNDRVLLDYFQFIK